MGSTRRNHVVARMAIILFSTMIISFLSFIIVHASINGGGGSGGGIPRKGQGSSSLLLRLKPSIKMSPRLVSRSSRIHNPVRRRAAHRPSKSTLSLQRQNCTAEPVETSIATLTASTKTKSKKQKRKKANGAGFYYGIQQDDLRPQSKRVPPPSQKQRQLPYPSKKQVSSSSRPMSLSETMGETLQELRDMREDLVALREEMRRLKKRIRLQEGIEIDDDDDDDEYILPKSFARQDEKGIEEGEKRIKIDNEQEIAIEEQDDDETQQSMGLIARMKRQRDYESVAADVERWAEKLLYEESGEENGWYEVHCNKMMKKSLNPDKTTTCFIKWMKDSRGKYAKADDDQIYPCIKLYSTIDAPIERVCDFLSDKTRIPEYNDLVVRHRDLEEISPHSKICWSVCPQILFVKPREFITFCHHKWKRDGTQVVINQAVDHEEFMKADGKGKPCRAYALRGANFISPNSTDPNKTDFCFVAHANPGGDLPLWAMKTAVNAVAPIEPFKLPSRLNKQIKQIKRTLEAPHRAEMIKSMPGRSSKPGGLAQLGYACFWPDGGGLTEGWRSGTSSSHDEMVFDDGQEEESSDFAHHRESEKVAG